MGSPELTDFSNRTGRRWPGRANGRSVRLALLLLAISFHCSCASTSRVNELARAGVAYGKAPDALLTATEETAVDAT